MATLKRILRDMFTTDTRDKSHRKALKKIRRAPIVTSLRT